MAGHSKWKNIRIRKGKQDALRGKLFTRLSREIIVAARAGGGDAGTNARLRVAIEKAREAAMPMDNIKRSIQRGTGEIEGQVFEECVYEGYGPGGSAVIVEVATDNKNRTVAEIRHAFSKNGGNLSENGSVSWQFKHVGQIVVDREGQDPDDVMLKALEAGAEDFVEEDGDLVVYTPIAGLHATNEALVAAGLHTSDVALTRIPTNWSTPSEDEVHKLVKMLDMLDELDDVQETYVNVNIPDEAYEEA